VHGFLNNHLLHCSKTYYYGTGNFSTVKKRPVYTTNDCWVIHMKTSHHKQKANKWMFPSCYSTNEGPELLFSKAVNISNR